MESAPSNALPSRTTGPTDSTAYAGAWARRLAALPAPAFVAIVLGATYVVVLPHMGLAVLFPALEVSGGPSRDYPIWGSLLFASVVVPVIETALFQALPWRVLQRFPHRSPVPYLVLASTLFAVSHWYSVGYILMTLGVGVVLAYGYALCVVHGRAGFWLITTVHGLRNAVATFVGVWFPEVPSA